MSELENQENKDEKKPRRLSIRRFCAWLSRKKEKFLQAVHERTKDVKHAKAKRIAVFVCAGIILLLFLLFYLTVGKMIAEFIQDASAFKKWMDGFDPLAEILVFLALRILQTAFKLVPGGALEIAAGFIFGVWWGFVWSMVGSILGSLLILLLGKKYGLRIVGLFVDPEILHSSTNTKKKRGVVFFLLYFLPWTPKDIYTWVASIADEKPVSFMVLSTLAKIPSVFVSAWCGAAIVEQKYFLALLILASLVLVGILGSVIYKATQKHKLHLLIKEQKEQEAEKPTE